MLQATSDVNHDSTMALRPFKPPSLKSIAQHVPGDVPSDFSNRPYKRQKRHADHAEAYLPGSTPSPNQGVTTIDRSPLHQIQNCPNLLSSVRCQHADEEAIEDTYYSVLWRKFTQKKNKTWDDDGYLSIKHEQATLYDSKGKCIGQMTCQKRVERGAGLSIGGREVEIGDTISKQEFVHATGAIENSSLISAPVSLPTSIRVESNTSVKSGLTLKEQLRQQLAKGKSIKSSKPAQPAAVSGQRIPFKQPLKNNTVLSQAPGEVPIPRHDPNTPGALVFTRPKNVAPGQQVVDVVLDPLLSNQLREHQRHGINFLYECVMGFRDFGGEGCILADDMGLGKTLQTIALLWTLIKQNPIYKAQPIIKKALIVCPVSLIQNWKKEFRKWLGRDRLGVLTFEDKGSRLSMFDGKNFKIMIVGYERLRIIAEDLNRGASIDIVICDEGHRLKTLQNKSAKAIESLNTSKRIILSGTPIQNDLSEFFAMANFVNDGVLGSYKSFVKDFENPILKSRQPDASPNDIEKGEYANDELVRATSQFILRRTADILSNYLPPRTEYVLFCKPTPEQASIYRQVLQSAMFQNALGSSDTALQLITILKKLCNSPALMRPDRGNDESTTSSSLVALNEMLPVSLSKLYSNRYSTKIRLLDELLQQIRTTTTDKVILVSNYTSTLNLMAQLLDNSGGRYLRLDGTVPQGKRQGLVDEFNRSTSATCFAFLLSAKAGGVGLNLIGANRLVLFDVDWNPATDDQAMARIHREGQTKPCKIYRFIIKGGLEEKIWQRQVVKRGLADSIMDGGSSKSASLEPSLTGKKGKAAFSREELRDLFRLDETDGLRTHDLIGCQCQISKSCLRKTVAASPLIIDHGESSGGGGGGDDDDNDEQELPDISTVIKASTLIDAMIRKHESLTSQAKRPHHGRQRRNADFEKQELMRFQHLDTSSVPDLTDTRDAAELESFAVTVDDECLTHVLRLETDVIAGRIAYIFKKTSGSVAVGEQCR